MTAAYPPPVESIGRRSILIADRPPRPRTFTFDSFMPAPKQLPLLFTFAQLVVGNGILAGVRMSGRALLEEEGDETWISGVAPVGFAAGGVDRAAAFIAFQATWHRVLVDIAAESGDFASFKKNCEAFLASSAEPTTKAWLDALADIRRSRYVDPALAREDKAEDRPITLFVEDLSQLESSDSNRSDFELNQAA